ncbi:MAG: hypothetical protein R2834_17165 [Rhodothermales bacterium]
MAKRSNRSKKDEAAPDASAWLEERMDDGLLDLDVLASMPISDVHAALKGLGAEDDGFTDSIKKRLAELDARPAPAARSARSADRPAASRQPAAAPARRWARLFTLRSALIVSAVVVIAVIVGPLVIRQVDSLRGLEPAYAPEVPAADTTVQEPTTFQGPASSEPDRGFRYIVTGLGRVALSTPLPENPGSLVATYEMSLRVDASGNVVSLEIVDGTEDPFEAAVMDSLLRWRFEPGRERGKTQAGMVTVMYAPIRR